MEHDYCKGMPEEMEEQIVRRIKIEYRNGYCEVVGLPLNESESMPKEDRISGMSPIDPYNRCYIKAGGIIDKWKELWEIGTSTEIGRIIKEEELRVMITKALMEECISIAIDRGELITEPLPTEQVRGSRKDRLRAKKLPECKF